MLVPKLRFKREDGTDYPEWNKDKWLSLGNFVSSGTLSKSDLSDTGTPCILYGELYTKYGEVAHTIYSKTSAEVHTFSQADDVILPKSGETPEDISTATCIPFDSISLGGDLIVFRHNEKVIGRYLSYLISNRTKNAIASIAQGKSVVHINEKSLSNIVLPYPVIEEQQKIADFLSALDEVIIQSEAEVRNLEQQKKSAMQKIFSQELRFKREDGTDYSEWSNKRFANAFTPLNNNTFSRDMLSENGTVLNIHYGDILVRFGEVCDIQTMDIPKVNTDIDTSRFDELQNGDIVLADTAEDETVGKAIEIYHIGTSKVVSGLHTMACRPTDKYAPKYMGYYINSPTYHNQLLPFMQGIKVTSIGRRNIADTVVYYPYGIEEQQKIADFLSALDEAISYAKQELNKWKELKKGLLQQMFV
jgi:type I restriction enzyme S subunit